MATLGGKRTLALGALTYLISLATRAARRSASSRLSRARLYVAPRSVIQKRRPFTVPRDSKSGGESSGASASVMGASQSTNQLPIVA